MLNLIVSLSMLVTVTANDQPLNVYVEWELIYPRNGLSVTEQCNEVVDEIISDADNTLVDYECKEAR